MSPDTFVVVLVSGLSGAALLFLVGSGLTLVFGALRIINLAHGSLYMLGAFLAVALIGAIGGVLGFAPGIVLASLAVGVLGGLIELAILRRLYQREHLMQLVATFSLILIISGAVRVIFGANFKRVSAPDFLTGSIPVGGSSSAAYPIFLVAVALAVVVGLYALRYRTGLGRTIRPAVADPALLRLPPVNAGLLFTTCVRICRLLAALGPS